jgi:hypothetical protein
MLAPLLRDANGDPVPGAEASAQLTAGKGTVAPLEGGGGVIFTPEFKATGDATLLVTSKGAKSVAAGGGSSTSVPITVSVLGEARCGGRGGSEVGAGCLVASAARLLSPF